MAVSFQEGPKQELQGSWFLGLELNQPHFCHILLVKASQNASIDSRGKETDSISWWRSCWNSWPLKLFHIGANSCIFGLGGCLVGWEEVHICTPMWTALYTCLLVYTSPCCLHLPPPFLRFLSLLHPLQSGFCSYCSIERALIKVTSDPHLAKLMVSSLLCATHPPPPSQNIVEASAY